MCGRETRDSRAEPLLGRRLSLRSHCTCMLALQKGGQACDIMCSNLLVGMTEVPSEKKDFEPRAMVGYQSFND